MANQVLVSGAGTTLVNGTYTQGTDIGGQPAYYLDNNNDIALYINTAGPNGGWIIRLRTGAQTYYYTTNLSAMASVPLSPIGITLITGTNPFTGSSLAGIAPVPTVTEYVPSSEPTFGLPADVVALITSRFGTVANFLRLRNQGQV